MADNQDCAAAKQMNISETPVILRWKVRLNLFQHQNYSEKNCTSKSLKILNSIIKIIMQEYNVYQLAQKCKDG